MSREGILILALLVLVSLEAPVLSDTDTNTADVVETLSGDRYERPKLIGKQHGVLTLSHSGGILTLNAADLTDASRRLLRVSADDLVTATPARRSAEQSLPAAQACLACRGFGSVVCPACRGGKFAHDIAVSTTCNTCKGRGFTYRKKVAFEYGGGAGKRKKYAYDVFRHACRQCNGTGKQSVAKRSYCSTCNGQGSTVCPTCHGSRRSAAPNQRLEGAAVPSTVTFPK